MGRPFAPHIITPDSALGGRDIGKSLRFNKDDTAYLRYLPGSAAASSTTFTFSAWVKRTQTGNWISIAGTDSGSNAFTIFGIDSNDRLMWRVRNSSSVDLTRKASSVRLRDTNSWYHLLLERNTTLSTAEDRAKLYINGVRVTDFDNNTNDSQNFTYTSDFLTDINIGRYQVNSSTKYYTHMYLAEYHYVDGQALDPSYFGYTEPQTGIWRPKKYEGTHGQNGFYLDFSDNSAATATTIGKDRSGNDNNVTPNNISVSAGVGNDSLEDTPTNNFATINALFGYYTDILIPTNGNLDFSLASNRFAICSHIIPTSGKWYAECVWTDVQTGDIGVFNPTRLEDDSQSFNGRWNGIVMKNNGYIRIDNTQVQSGLTSITAGAIIGILIDRDAGTVSFTINGTANGTPILLSTMHFQDGGFTIRAGRNSSSGSNPTGSFNFGQRPFSYLPSGYRSLCDKNMTTPTGASIVRPQKHFETVIYTGDNTEYRKIPLEFKADLVWWKRRDATQSHVLSDSVTAITKHLIPNNTTAQTTPGYPYASSVQDDGIILRGGTSSGGNISGRSMVAWCWKAGGSSNTFNVDGKGYATAAAAGITDGTLALTGASVNTKNGFSITKYVGTGSAGTVAHGLGKKPTLWIMKNTSDVSEWFIYFTIYNESLDYFKFDTDAFSNSGASAPTTTTVSATSSLSTSGHTWVVYAWTDIPGYSKVGVYKGNGDANGPYIPLGFRPAFVIMKELNNDGTNWVLYDNKRNTTNPVNLSLYPNLNNAEGDASLDYDFLSNGFKVRTTNGGINANGDTYLYMAFAEQAGFVPYMAPTNAR